MAEYFDRTLARRRFMDDSIEADLLAARRLPFAAEEPAWTDRYVVALSRLEPALVPARAAESARRAWRAYAWAHPAVVAWLEHETGPLDGD